MPIFLRLLILFAGILLTAPMVRAEVRDVSQVVSVEVMPGWRRADGVHVAGLRITLARGWKTYWRSAGAAGISPQMDWRGSRGLRSVTPVWPTPTVFRQGDALSIGYDHSFVLPLLIAAGAGPVDLRGVLDIGVCAEICLPARVRVAARLDAGGPPDPTIRAALADRPREVRAPARCLLSPVDHGIGLTGLIDVAPQGRAEAVVFEVPDPAVWVTDASIVRRGGRLVARARLLSSGRGIAVDRSSIRMTVIGTDGAVEITGCTG